MVIKLGDFLDGKIERKTDKCPDCGNNLIQSQCVIRDGKQVWICGDCYYGQFGDEIDKHPIVNPELSIERQKCHLEAEIDELIDPKISHSGPC